MNADTTNRNTDTEPPKTLSVSLSAMADLGVEHWRLSTTVGDRAPAAARHALRKIGDLLRTCELEVRSLTGQPFDAGLAARVVHTEANPSVPPGKVIIAETLSPMVLWRGVVLRPADVVTHANQPG